MPKIFLLNLLLIPILFLLTACGSEPKEGNSHQSNVNSIRVTDNSGVVITLNSPAERIIALAPHIVENVYSAGAGSQLVASVDYANYPPESENLPKVGGYNKFNIESIAALQPDVIFVWESGTPKPFIDKIKQLGIPVYLDEPSTLEEIADSIRNIGKLTGNDEVAKQAAEKHLSDLAALRQSQVNKDPVNVFYQVWDDPLYTINGKQIISSVLRLCGGINIYADEKIKAPIISLESLIERNPQVIMTGSTHESTDKSLDRWKKWPNMTAVAHENLFVVNADIVSRHTVRLIQGATSICQKLDIARANLKK